MSDMILELTNVQRTYKMGRNRIEVLKDVSLVLPKGEWCCVYGASGSGKTTLLNLVGSLEQPDGGSVVINGVDVSTFKRRQAAEFRLRYLGFIFQSYHLLSELTVLENVTLPGEISGIPRSKVRARALELLEKVGLENRLKHRPSELSGGEQQRVAIARSLINSPKLLLADEPTGNLDFRTGGEILELFRELRENDPELTLFMITHNREIAANATKVVELKDGILI